jgi:O-antigen/teichoic acid export membrane protein
LNIGLNIGLNIFFIAICPKLFGTKSNLLYNPSIGVGYIFISNLAASVFTIFLLIPEIKQATLKIDKAVWQNMLKYAFPLLIAGLAGMINETMDRVLLKFFLPKDGTVMTNIGIYGACYNISIILTIFIQTFRYAAEPFFFSQQKNKDSSILYAKVLHYFVIICSFIFLVTMSYIDIVKYFVGEAFREGLNIVPILLIANLFLGVFINLSIWYKLSGQTKYGAYLTIIGACITLVANWILIPIYGYTGAAWATLICYGTIMIISYLLGQQKFYIPYNLPKLCLYLLLALVFFGLEKFVFETLSFELRILLNTTVIIAYLLYVYFAEKSGFKEDASMTTI